ncbi:MAG: DinB family protein [Ignavibacteriales bacterium]|nr:DinB family protein [Ignavibacteriales bacterium]
MFRTVEDFLTSWKHEKETTLKMLNNLTDESLGTKVTPTGRDLGFIAWHITLSCGEMAQASGFIIDGFDEKQPRPATAGEIIATFTQLADAITEMVKSSFKDEDLMVTIPVYGEEWKRGFLFTALVSHTIHHRGQMTVLMRQAGLKVPGAYGPSREEWVTYGMPAQD